jgi:hypothetical protein
VLGDAHFSNSKSPGLVKNVLAIISIIFDTSSVAASLATATEPSEAPPAKKAKATSRKDRHAAPVADGHGQAEVQAAKIDPKSTDHLSIADLAGADMLGNGGSGQASVLSYLRQRYDNQAAAVIQIMKA